MPAYAHEQAGFLLRNMLVTSLMLTGLWISSRHTDVGMVCFQHLRTFAAKDC